MISYIIRRILYIIPILIGAAFILFILFNVLPGDPALLMLGKHVTEQQILDLRAELGLNQPLWLQFFQYLGQVFTFDFGRSYATKQPITQMILDGMGPSAMFAFPFFIFTFCIAISLGLLVAYKRGQIVDKFFVVLCVLGMSIPSLAIILFGQYFFAYKLGWFPISGYSSYFPDAITYLLLPILLWFIVSLGYDLRFYRTAILDETNQDYVRTARAKGVPEWIVLYKHVLRNSLIPVTTYLLIELPFLILGVLLVENFFSIPGLGSMTVEAFNNRDYPVIKAVATLSCLFIIFINLLTDILYTWIDPRVALK
jgi:peptide/nickel transport system permease protein